jgi:hypothetical protein
MQPFVNNEAAPSSTPLEPRSPGGNGLRSTLASAIIGFLPIAFVWLYKVVLHPRPFWVFYYDPETIYFYGGASILRHAVPWNLDNPGLPLHALSAAVLAVTGTSPLLLDRFRLVAYCVAAVLTFGAMLLLSHTLLSRLSIPYRIVALWTFFLCPMSLEYISVWSPELFYLPFGSLVLAAASTCFAGNASARRFFCAGLFIGVAVALKFTFLAWVPAFFLALLVHSTARNVRFRALLLPGGVASGFLVGTGFLVTRYKRMFSWLLNLATHSGSYGSGPADTPSSGELYANLMVAISSAKAWHLWLLFLALVAAYGLWKSRRRGRADAWGESLFLFFLCATAATYAMALRHFGLRYLLPSGVAAIALAALSLRILADSAPPRVAAVIFLVAAVLLGKHIVLDLNTHDIRIEESRTVRGAIEREINKHSPPGRKAVTIYSFRAPIPSFALRINTDRPEDQVAISQAYPYEGHLSWDNRIVFPAGASHWDIAVLTDSARKTFPDPIGPAFSTIGPFVIAARANPLSSHAYRRPSIERLLPHAFVREKALEGGVSGKQKG